MKQAYKKGICAALIAACLLTVAFAAATKLNLLRGWLDEDSIGELVVNTDKQSVETEDFRLTIEDHLCRLVPHRTERLRMGHIGRSRAGGSRSDGLDRSGYFHRLHFG